MLQLVLVEPIPAGYAGAQEFELLGSMLQNILPDNFFRFRKPPLCWLSTAFYGQLTLFCANSRSKTPLDHDRSCSSPELGSNSETSDLVYQVKGYGSKVIAQSAKCKLISRYEDGTESYKLCSINHGFNTPWRQLRHQQAYELLSQ